MLLWVTRAAAARFRPFVLPFALLARARHTLHSWHWSNAQPAQRAQPARVELLAVLALLAIGALASLVGCGGREVAQFEEGVAFTGVTMPTSAAPGGSLPLDFTFKTTHPLEGDWWVFIHIESAGPPNCRIVFDRPPSDGAASTWHGEVIHHKVEVPVPATCKPGRLEVHAGLYNRGTFARLKVIEPSSLDNRLPVGWIDIVERGADPARRALSPRDLKMRSYLVVGRPWARWGIATGAATVLAIIVSWILRRRGTRLDDERPQELNEDWRWFSRALPAVPLILGILCVLEFVKDDAYISFRYAHNLVTGKGLVFNPGERLEGFTNFLWTMILAPFEALGWDLFQVCEVLGTVLSIGVIVQVIAFTAWFQPRGERKDLSHVWGAMWLATSSSWVLWAKSGLEQPLAALLPLVSCGVLWHGQDEDDPPGGRHLGWWSGILMGLGCMTRPEIHLMGAIVGVALVIEAVWRRRLAPVSLRWAAGLLAVTVPFHAFRLLYFKSLLPNTFYVKTGSSAFVWKEGLKQLYEMFAFNDLGLLVVIVPFAFLTRRFLARKLVVLTIVVAFMAYIVKVGVDEMQWFRLYLPAMPFLVLLAGMGLQNLCDAIVKFVKRPIAKPVVFAGGWVLVLFLCSNSFRFTYREMGGFNGHADLSGMYHPDLGKFLTRHERPGGLVAFQDMGSTPYHAPDVNFLDFIGLVDGTVARARHSYGLHAFIASEGQSNRATYDAEMREYYWRRNPEWAILTVYPPADMVERIADAFDKDPGPDSMLGAYSNNSYQFGIWDDPRFLQRYVHVRTWQRSRGYYLSLFRRRDLWEQTPREVVLDAPPPTIGGVKATLEGGLELLGSEVDRETLERHEVFITTWWKLPGPLPSDTVFFVHVSKPGYQVPLDHTPGDSMYPADRWQAGQTLEDRVLFQLPITMAPGDYDVYIGVYRRSTGERLHVLDGGLPDRRIHLGSFHVKRMLPFVHQLIPPTRVDKMRKYPERIVSSGR